MQPRKTMIDRVEREKGNNEREQGKADKRLLQGTGLSVVD